ncbi:hypothetical protein Tco_0847634 [Tanacetum coccineum]
MWHMSCQHPPTLLRFDTWNLAVQTSSIVSQAITTDKLQDQFFQESQMALHTVGYPLSLHFIRCSSNSRRKEKENGRSLERGTRREKNRLILLANGILTTNEPTPFSLMPCLLTISLDRLDIFEGRSCISEFVRKSLSLILELS